MMGLAGNGYKPTIMELELSYGITPACAGKSR